MSRPTRRRVAVALAALGLALLPAVALAGPVVEVARIQVAPAAGAEGVLVEARVTASSSTRVVSVVEDLDSYPGSSGLVAVAQQTDPAKHVRVFRVFGLALVAPGSASTPPAIPVELAVTGGQVAKVDTVMSKTQTIEDERDLTNYCSIIDMVTGLTASWVGFGGRSLESSVKPLVRRCEAWSIPKVGSTVPSSYSCNGQITKLFTSFTGGVAVNGGKAPTFSTNGQAYCLTAIQTYHWNGGSGKAPGTVGLTRLSGPTGLGSAGPFPAVGSAGQNNAPNVNWQANVPTSPTPTVIDGTYECTDSDPATWSSDRSVGTTFCAVYGIPAQTH